MVAPATGKVKMQRQLDEIEITEEMIAAGAKVIIDYFHLAPDWLPNDICAEVYRAMIFARIEAPRQLSDLHTEMVTGRLQALFECQHLTTGERTTIGLAIEEITELGKRSKPAPAPAPEQKSAFDLPPGLSDFQLRMLSAIAKEITAIKEGTSYHYIAERMVEALRKFDHEDWASSQPRNQKT
jgi:hypothetical protein